MSTAPDRAGLARIARLAQGAWPARIAWLSLPLLCGPAFGDALADASRPVQVVASTGLWLGWAAALVASFVPSTLSLTVLRVAAPAPVVAAIAAAAAGGPSTADVVAVGGATLVALVVFWPGTGEAFVDGSSYGDERRLPLRVPGPLLLGPVELVWCALALGAAAGPLLLAARQWVAGGLALAAGLPLAWLAARSLHALARRWVVFVPAGLVVHDPLSLVDPVLVPRAALRSLGPAPAGTTALDLTRGAVGLALEVRLTEPVRLLLVRPPGGTDASVTTDELLFAPSRPGEVLSEARRRRLAA